MIINENGWGDKPQDKPKGKKDALKVRKATPNDGDGSQQSEDGKEVEYTSVSGERLRISR